MTPPQDALPEDLAGFLGDIRARMSDAPAPEPPFAPDPGEDEMAWRGRMRAVRAAHDAHALAWRSATDEAARARYGRTAGEILGAVPVAPGTDIAVPVGADPRRARARGRGARRAGRGRPRTRHAAAGRRAGRRGGRAEGRYRGGP